MLKTEINSLTPHQIHVTERMRKRAQADLLSLNNNLLPERSLRQSAGRIDNNERIIRLSGGTDALVVCEVPFQMRTGDEKKRLARIIPGLSQIVEESVGKDGDAPNYAKWLSTPGKVPFRHLGTVAEAIVWEMVSADKSDKTIQMKYSTSLKRLAEKLVDEVSVERTEARAAWRYAVAYAALATLKPKAGTTLHLISWLDGADHFTNEDDGWADNESLMGYNPRAQKAIMEKVRKVEGVPDTVFMDEVIEAMDPMPTFPWLEDKF